MKITTKLALEYMKKNKRRSIVTIVRNCDSYNTHYCSHDTFFKLSRIHDK